MRFLSLSGVLKKARRYVSSGLSMTQEDVKEPARLTQLLKRLTERVSDLEASSGPEATEFEVTAPVHPGTVSLNHGFGCPVRWYVVHWVGANIPGFSVHASSTTDTLVLTSFQDGVAVIRVEPSQYGLT